MENKIYNIEKKTSFLQTLSLKEQEHARRMFGQTYKYESNAGKDMAELDRIDDIKKCISSMEYVDNSTKGKHIKYFRMYFKFCGNSYIDAFTNGEIGKYMIKKERSIFVFSEILEIEEKFNQIYGEKSWYYNAILFCVFYGFSINKMTDFLNLKVSDIKDSKIYLSNGREIDCSDKPKLIKYLKLTIDNECEYNYQSNGHSGYIGMFEDSVFKFSAKKLVFDKERFIRSTSKRMNDALKQVFDRKVLMINISDSGFCFYLKSILEANGESLSDLFDKDSKYRNSVISNAIVDFGIERSLNQATMILSEYSRMIESNRE